MAQAWDALSSLSRRAMRMREPWLIASADFADATHLRIKAAGTWTIADGIITACGPAGHAALPLKTEALLLPTAPPGALLGKFGGSTAGVGGPGPEGGAPADAPFLLGGECILIPPPGAHVLMIGINIVNAIPARLYSLKVSLEQIRA